MIPEDFHRMAQDMYDDPNIIIHSTVNSTDDECFYRTLIDRAYYAAFLKSKEWVIINEGYTPYNSGKDHYNVRIALKNAKSLGKKRHAMAGKLYDLKKARGNASYDLSLNFNQSDAKYYLDRSELLIKDLK